MTQVHRYGISKPLVELEFGEIGLVDFSGHDIPTEPPIAACIRIKTADFFTVLLLPEKQFKYNSNYVRGMILAEHEVYNWPDPIVLENPSIIPDINSLRFANEWEAFSLIVGSDATYIIAKGQSPGNSCRVIDLSNGDRVSGLANSKHWAYRKWSICVPDPRYNQKVLEVFKYSLD